jgi:hypothetical protein
MSAPRDVHPVADLFPMLGPDELADLAADIAERGLLDPIVLDVEGRILDGRNRLAACEKAEVVPEFVTYEGDDPIGYALAKGVLRRELRSAQRYIVMEAGRRLAEPTLRKRKVPEGANAQRLAEAAVVLDWAPHLAAEIMAGSGMGLGAAAEMARTFKADAELTQMKRDALRAHTPDLLDLVSDGRLTIGEALSAMEARMQKEEDEAERERQRIAAEQSAADAATARKEAEYRDLLDRRAARLAKFAVGWGELCALADEPPYAGELLALLTDGDRVTVLEGIDIYRKATQ